MSVILYKKVDDEWQSGKFASEGINIEQMAKSGWLMKKIEPEAIEVEIEKPNGPTEDQAIRQQAKDAGISSWHLKKIEKLKEELGLNDAEQPEIGSD